MQIVSPVVSRIISKHSGLGRSLTKSARKLRVYRKPSVLRSGTGKFLENCSSHDTSVESGDFVKHMFPSHEAEPPPFIRSFFRAGYRVHPPLV